LEAANPRDLRPLLRRSGAKARIFAIFGGLTPGEPCVCAEFWGAIEGSGVDSQNAVAEVPDRRRNIRRKQFIEGQFKGRGRMNKLELVEHVAKEADISKASAAAALEATLDGIAKSLKKGDEVRLVGFGTFSVRERAAGKGRNPATGKEIKIPASKNARFKAGASLKASLNKKAAAKK
jgi:DNA-binding protein HU-beta